MPFKSINPATRKEIKSYRASSHSQTARALSDASKAFSHWSGMPLHERGKMIRAVAVQLRKNMDRYSHLMTLEMGKPISQSRAECEKCAATCDYFAEHAAEFLKPEPVTTDATKSFVTFQPLGVVLAIMPWNFPFWQVFRCAVPALMAGNCIIMKPAPNTSGCGLGVQEIMDAAGLPAGVFNTLLLGNEQIEKLIQSPLIQAVTLTGSVRAGKAVAAIAGAALKKTVLELGGSDACLVLPDCDLEKTAETCVASRMINAGQSCIAAKRFIVVEKVRRQFEKMFVSRMQAQIVGDPLQEATQLGPLAREDLRRNLHSQVTRSVRKGAKLLCGGKIPKSAGWFYPPTVVTDVCKGMPAFDEEMFGPVAAIISARDEAHAILLANDSSFGLGASVFTRDLKRGERIAAEELQAGNCFVNDSVRSDPRLPFGGMKESGYGRELGRFGIREFTNIKTVWIK